MSSKDASEAVLKYLRDQNRPYSANDIVLNLHKEFGKTGIQKALDNLVAQDLVIEKVNGKQKAYVVNQKDLPTASESELAALDSELTRITSELKEKSEELRAKEASLKKLNSAITTKEAKRRIEELTKETEALEERLNKLTNNKVLVTKEEKEKVEKNLEVSVNEWKKRKRMCLNITDAILESYPKSKKVLFEEIGIETDEDVGAKIPDI